MKSKFGHILKYPLSQETLSTAFRRVNVISSHLQQVQFSSRCFSSSQILHSLEATQGPTILKDIIARIQCVSSISKGKPAEVCSEFDDESNVQRFMEAYRNLQDADKKNFYETWYQHLSKNLDPDMIPLQIKNLDENEARLVTSVVEVIESIMKAKNGIRFCLDMRADLLKIMHTSKDTNLRALDLGFRIPLMKSFDPWNLRFNRLTLNSPAIIFKRIIENERVHAYRGEGWLDIQQRIGNRRRLFFFEHPQMSGFPVAFLHTAYSNSVITRIDDVFNPTDTQLDSTSTDTAIFYSISSIEPGLRGIELGSILIKRAVDYIQGESPNIVNFYTLSPIPQFLPWLKKTLQTRGSGLISEEEVRIIHETALSMGFSHLENLDINNVHVHLMNLVNLALKRDPEFVSNASNILHPWKFTLMRLCAIYMLKEKDPRGNAIDPVTNFHIRNGARVARLNWQANLKPEGLAQSFGIMTNYQYELNHLQERSDAYISSGKVTIDETLSASSLLFWSDPLSPSNADLFQSERRKPESV